MKNNKNPQERDLTGTTFDLDTCSYVGTTGDAVLDDTILDLAKEIADDS